MCECRKDIEQKLLDKFTKENPGATRHAVSLDGYAFFVAGDEFVERGLMPVRRTAEFPLKNGKLKEKALKGSMMFNFCPFCGERYAEKTTAKDAAEG